MADNFQNIIDNALQGIEVHSVEGEVHFQPIAEEAHQMHIIEQLQKRVKQKAGPERVHVGAAGAFNFQSQHIRARIKSYY